MLEKNSQPNNFNFLQLFNDSEGRSAISLVAAYMLCCVGSGCFIYCLIMELPYLTEACIMTGLGTALFGVRAIKK